MDDRTAALDWESPAGPVFAPDETRQFDRDGFVIVRNMVPAAVVAAMRSIVRRDLDEVALPVEFEAEVRYPGAPVSRQGQGGDTIRRLKEAHSRSPVFAHWVSQPALVGRLQQLLGQPAVLPLAHHNCVMTKQPQFSSETHWHKDIRYWSYTRPDLISVWLALGSERPENGGLWVIPGSHSLTFEPRQFDAALFFREDLADNFPLLATKLPVELNAGDVLFFHCRTLHAAGRNTTSEPKFSVVFTFRPRDNPPLPGSRSAAAPEVALPEIVAPL